MAYSKSTYSRWFNLLKKWAKKRFNITLVFDSGQGDRYIGEERTVYVNTCQSRENQLFSLLHELGHAQARKSEKTFCKKYNLLAESEITGNPVRSNAYRIQLLEEEIQAWRNGERIADKLKIRLDKRTYNNYAALCVMSYVDWAARREWQVSAYA